VGIEAEDGIAEAEVAEVIEEESSVDYPPSSDSSLEDLPTTIFSSPSSEENPIVSDCPDASAEENKNDV
jgi:hypothetical protein